MSKSKKNRSRRFKSTISLTTFRVSKTGNFKSNVGTESHKQSYGPMLEEVKQIISSDTSDSALIEVAMEKLYFLVGEKYAPAEYILGVMFINDDSKALQEKGLYWIQSAAKSGDALAQSDMGTIFLQGKFGKTQSSIQAFEWFKLSADQGCAEGQCNLALLYLGFHGIERDYFKAATLYKSAALKGLCNAQFELSLMYENGMGVPYDRKASLYWARKAADGGYLSAQLYLANRAAHSNDIDFEEEFDAESVAKFELAA